MWGETMLRFLLGGAVVSIFAIASNLFSPKTFAGIFGAAPSLALATLALTYWKWGPPRASLEGRSMIAGGVAMVLYCRSAASVIARGVAPWIAASLLWLQWLATVLVVWAVLARR